MESGGFPENKKLAVKKSPSFFFVTFKNSIEYVTEDLVSVIFLINVSE